ncbi:type IV pilin protein [Thiomonas sp.]|uniref:type IV pilin protein n=1 Tax=Thiomonas sp. TaxID=2047785 RepID=UPI002604C722|nr:type IV pilin protein [Thiomonas sp.]
MKPRPPRRPTPARGQGWSLPELVVTLLVVALLALQALTPLERALQRGRRACATAVLLELALLQERYHARQGRYARSLAELGRERTPEGQPAWPDEHRAWYRLRMSVRDATPERAAGYDIVAEPVGRQRGDVCGSLRIDHLGRHQAGVPDCW